jgi:hypothetical protein
LHRSPAQRSHFCQRGDDCPRSYHRLTSHSFQSRSLQSPLRGVEPRQRASRMPGGRESSEPGRMQESAPRAKRVVCSLSAFRSARTSTGTAAQPTASWLRSSLGYAARAILAGHRRPLCGFAAAAAAEGPIAHSLVPPGLPPTTPSGSSARAHAVMTIPGALNNDSPVGGRHRRQEHGFLKLQQTVGCHQQPSGSPVTSIILD